MSAQRYRYLSRVVALSCLFFVNACTTMSDAPNPLMHVKHALLREELRAITEDADHPLASLSTLVIRDGRVVFEGQFGRKFIDNKTPARDGPAHRDTMYRIASISKLVTTLGGDALSRRGQACAGR